MSVRWIVPLVAAVALTAGSAAAQTPPRTRECRGLNPCVAVAGPWVVVPAGSTVPRVKAQWQLACPRGWVVGGTDAELSDGAIDLAFVGASGAPVSPGVTTARTLLFVASWAGRADAATTIRPHIGCIPTAGGGRRTPTGVAAVVPPGKPTVRRAVTSRVAGTKRIVARCRADERLVDWYATRAFSTTAPPAAALVSSLTVSVRAAESSAVAVARAARGRAVVQVAAVCAGGK